MASLKEKKKKKQAVKPTENLSFNRGQVQTLLKAPEKNNRVYLKSYNSWNINLCCAWLWGVHSGWKRGSLGEEK